MTKRSAHRPRGMTLVELLIAVAITSLVSLAGWRAIDVLQRARDQAQADALAWQRVERLFEAIESDLRRAEFSDFSGTEAALRLRLIPIAPMQAGTDVEWRWLRDEDGRWRVRRSGPDGAYEIALGAEAARMAYSADGRAWQTDSAAYPMALRINLRLPGLGGDIERLLVLR